MPVEFDQALITGQIGWKFTEITWYACLVEFGGHNLNGFTPNLTSRIQPVKLGVNPLRLHCLLKAFDRSNSIGRIGCKSIEITLPVKGIRPVEFDRSNWV